MKDENKEKAQEGKQESKKLKLRSRICSKKWPLWALGPPL